MQSSRADYCHPYQPYDIQLEFMKCLYQSIEDEKVAIFESPTGTGKSLSLICGALTWLRDNARREIEGFAGAQGEEASDDWLVTAERATRKREFLRELAETEKKLIAIRKKEIARQEAEARTRVFKKARVDASGIQLAKSNDDDYMLDEYTSDNEKAPPTSGNLTLSSSTLALLDKLKPTSCEKDESEQDRVKVIFCSRTHSQLTQLVNELRKVSLPSGLPRDESQPGLSQPDEVVKHLPLGSRKNLCINDRVLRLSSTLAINEKCLDLQKPGTARKHKCPYLPGRDDKAKVEAFRDRAIATIRDIEDLGKLGRRTEVCPYYASRSAILSSEVLTLPYPLLLQKSAREALGVEVKGNVVVIDEAHNLMDAIADTLSISLSLSQLEVGTTQVITYVQRFKNKLKGMNRMYVTQLIRLLNSFTDCLRHTLAMPKGAERAIVAADLMSGKGVDQVRPHKLLQYLVQSKLAYKVEGYMESRDQHAKSPSRGILMLVQNFLAVLMNPGSEGRFFVSRQDTDVLVRYTLLDPQEHFRDIVEQARAVILAGGTMSPMSDYRNYLFSYLDAGRLSTFSFGHVIPTGNMLVEPLVKGPSGIEFDFTYEKRGSESMIVELGKMLIEVCHTVPDGVIVFFPSYEFLSHVTAVWKRATVGDSITDSLAKSKKIFEEVRGLSSDDLLREYCQAIGEGNGAIMLSVVGGKLSEGINFSDNLGRAVVAVGLPFPNMHGAEWKAKIEHVEVTRYKQCRDSEGLTDDRSRSEAKAAGRDFYENACMRAVNQSIGRAIRHKNDYAAILLVDKRFATERIQRKLPDWIRGSMENNSVTDPLPLTMRRLQSFFQEKH